MDPKEWVYATFKWTPADLLRVFRSTYHEICYTGAYANDYPELWAKFDGIDATQAHWRKGSAELCFSYYLKRGDSVYARSEEWDAFNQQLQTILQRGIDRLRQRYRLRVQHEEYVKWMTMRPRDPDYSFRDNTRFMIRVFGTNSKWTQKEINAQNNKIAKLGHEAHIKTFVSSY